MNESTREFLKKRLEDLKYDLKLSHSAANDEERYHIKRQKEYLERKNDLVQKIKELEEDLR